MTRTRTKTGPRAWTRNTLSCAPCSRHTFRWRPPHCPNCRARPRPCVRAIALTYHRDPTPRSVDTAVVQHSTGRTGTRRAVVAQAYGRPEIRRKFDDGSLERQSFLSGNPEPISQCGTFMVAKLIIAENECDVRLPHSLAGHRGYPQRKEGRKKQYEPSDTPHLFEGKEFARTCVPGCIVRLHKACQSLV